MTEILLGYVTLTLPALLPTPSLLRVLVRFLGGETGAGSSSAGSACLGGDETVVAGLER